MAPRKEKTDKLPADDGSQLVLDYLKRQNRPYSATDVSANLHNKVTKTQAVKILKELHDKKEIAGKAAGKQLVYHALQLSSDSLPGDGKVDANTEQGVDQIRQLDAQIQTLRDIDLIRLRAEERAIRSQATTLGTIRTTAELESELDDVRQRFTAVRDRLKLLRPGDITSGKEQSVAIASVEQRQNIDREYSLWTMRTRSRRHICGDLWALVLETKDPLDSSSDFWDVLGCEGPLP